MTEPHSKAHFHTELLNGKNPLKSLSWIFKNPTVALLWLCFSFERQQHVVALCILITIIVIKVTVVIVHFLIVNRQRPLLLPVCVFVSIYPCRLACVRVCGACLFESSEDAVHHGCSPMGNRPHTLHAGMRRVCSHQRKSSL